VLSDIRNTEKNVQNLIFVTGSVLDNLGPLRTAFYKSSAFGQKGNIAVPERKYVTSVSETPFRDETSNGD
jgi:hypothetical protein